MATKVIHRPPIPASHVSIIPTNKPLTAIRFRESSNPLSCPRRFSSHLSVKSKNTSDLAAAANDEAISEQQSTRDYNRTQIKQTLFAALQGINRGIFGVTSEKKCEIENLVVLLEPLNPTAQPTLSLEKVAGTWKLIYSTITILGSKRTKLGLRDFINLGDFFQSINIAERVDISYNKSAITPDQLMNVFRKNYHILLQIFNPEGWLEITYVDDSLRIGRDDKGNIFILERVGNDDDGKS